VKARKLFQIGEVLSDWPQALQCALGEEDGQAVDDGITTAASHAKDGACFGTLDFEAQGCVAHGADEVPEVLFRDGCC
jgi:hypothetical protein